MAPGASTLSRPEPTNLIDPGCDKTLKRAVHGDASVVNRQVKRLCRTFSGDSEWEDLQEQQARKQPTIDEYMLDPVIAGSSDTTLCLTTLSTDTHDSHVVEAAMKAAVEHIKLCDEQNHQVFRDSERLGSKLGGKLRGLRGLSVEGLCKIIVSKINEEIGGASEVAVIKGDNCKVAVPYGSHLHEVQVDCHVVRENPRNLLGFVECKSYLDDCTHGRATEDMVDLHRTHPALPGYILALEDAGSADSRHWRNSKRVTGIDDIFFLYKGKRNSNKPLYDPQHAKPLDTDALQRFCTAMYQMCTAKSTEHEEISRSLCLRELRQVNRRRRELLRTLR